MLFLETVRQSYNTGMDLLMQICFFVAGFYGLYTCRNMGRWEKLPANKILYPQGCPTSTCDDPEALKKFMYPRLMTFSILCILVGAASFVISRYLSNAPLYAMATAMVGLLAVVYYMSVIRRASKKFWNQ